MHIFENATKKIVRSKDYNYDFNKDTGFFARWGVNKEDDPLFSPFGPEIADIEVTTKCSGVGGKLCPFCYKANTPNGKNMSFETFKKMIDKFPTYTQKSVEVKNLEDNSKAIVIIPSEEVKPLPDKMKGKFEIVNINEKEVPPLTQVAFGADSRAESNPDLWKMMDYCRELGIIPNITVAEITDETADKLVSKCGAVAVSRVYIGKKPIKLRKLKKKEGKKKVKAIAP